MLYRTLLKDNVQSVWLLPRFCEDGRTPPAAGRRPGKQVCTVHRGHASWGTISWCSTCISIFRGLILAAVPPLPGWSPGECSEDRWLSSTWGFRHPVSFHRGALPSSTCMVKGPTPTHLKLARAARVCWTDSKGEGTGTWCLFSLFIGWKLITWAQVTAKRDGQRFSLGPWKIATSLSLKTAGPSFY